MGHRLGGFEFGQTFKLLGEAGGALKAALA